MCGVCMNVISARIQHFFPFGNKLEVGEQDDVSWMTSGIWDGAEHCVQPETDSSSDILH